MKYTQKQKDIMLIGFCLMGAWIAFGLFVFGDIAVIFMAAFALGYVLAKVN